jgi:hypothetical protein
VSTEIVKGVFGSVKCVRNKKKKGPSSLSEKGVLQLTTRNHKNGKKRREINQFRIKR